MFKNILLILAGAAVGSAVTWKITKTMYEKNVQEEINEIKEAYVKKYEPTTEVEKTEEVAPVEDARAKAEAAKNKASVSEYAAKIREHGYTPYANVDNEEDSPEENEEEEREEMDAPYVISPEEVGESDYDIVGLTYYADKMLADDNDDLVEDVESLVGFESLNHFGEFEDDSVYVRNDRLKIDYEILLDQRTYAEVRKGRPSAY